MYMYTPETSIEENMSMYVYVYSGNQYRREYVCVCMYTPETNIEENMSMYVYVYSGKLSR